MNTNTIAIPIALTLIASMLAWVIISLGKGRWQWKLAAIVIGTWFGLTVWSALDSYLGWPSTEKLPKKFVILWTEIHEPDKRAGDEGRIYVVVQIYNDPDQTKVLAYRQESNEPRLYRLPYGRGMHEQMESAQNIIDSGGTVVGENLPEEGTGEKKAPKSVNANPDNPPPEAINGEENGVDSGTKGGRYKFYKLPPAKLPRKIVN